jgi:citrate/tricarballylate utilization protein
LDETQAIQDARRAMEVCNACRYCEGFCAVFPAMELRREFAQADLNYLANLCHGCKGCYYACQYAPPHEFGINVPATLAKVRTESYAQYAWPAPLAALYRRNGLVMSVAMAGGVAVVLLLAMLQQRSSSMFGAHNQAPGHGFYDVVPYGEMVWVASATFLFSMLALALGFLAFWKDTGGKLEELTQGAPLKQALHDAATLKYLDGGGQGCNETGEGFGFAKKHYHHAMAYGFLLCFASTSVATIYHDAFGWRAPYAFFSLPVILGTLGGLGLMLGTAGLFRMKLVGDQEPQARALLGADSGLLLLLFLLGFSGLLLLGLRATGAMGVALTVHLGLVLALFVTIPYSKFVHGLYRFGALLRHAMERPGV